MNSNDFSHLVPKRNANRRPNLFIRCSDIDFEVEKRKYVEFVCDILVQGRFGPDRVKPVVIDLSERPRLEPVSFLDVCDGEPNEINWLLLPCYSLPSPGRALCQQIEAAYRRAKQMGLCDAAPNAHNSPSSLPPNQGRGSP